MHQTPEACARQVTAEAKGQAKAAVDACREALKQEYGVLETQLSISYAPAASGAPDQALTADSAAKLLALLLVLPHGVIKYSHAVPGASPASLTGQLF
jgi:dipeptidase D